MMTKKQRTGIFPKKWKNCLIQLLFEEKCLICGRLMSHFNRPPYPLCSNCESLFRPLEQPFCRICGLPLISEDNLCCRCRKRSYNFDKHRALFVYGHYTRNLINAYKSSQYKQLSHFFSFKLARIICEEFPERLIVPVPSCRSSVRKRGWDQMRVIGRILSKRYAIPYAEILQRGKSAEQKSLSFSGRAANLRGKIHIKPCCIDMKTTVLLIDDVFTTGATMNECAWVLKSYGLSHVSALSIAIDT